MKLLSVTPPLDPDTIGSLQREFGKAAESVPHIHTFYFPPFKPFACQGIFLESREKSDNTRGFLLFIYPSLSGQP